MFATGNKPNLPRFLRPLDTDVLCRTCCSSFSYSLEVAIFKLKGKEKRRMASKEQSCRPSVQLIYNQYISVAAAPLRLGIMARYFNNLLTIKIHLLRNRRANGARSSLTADLLFWYNETVEMVRFRIGRTKVILVDCIVYKDNNYHFCFIGCIDNDR